MFAKPAQHVNQQENQFTRIITKHPTYLSHLQIAEDRQVVTNFLQLPVWYLMLIVFLFSS